MSHPEKSQCFTTPKPKLSTEDIKRDILGGISLRSLKTHVHDFEGIEPVEQPKIICPGKFLKEYQLQGVAEGMARLIKHHGHLLTDEKGRGKTIQSIVMALALLKKLPRLPNEGGILIVVRESAVSDWEKHLHEFFVNENRPSYIIAHNSRTPKTKDFSLTSSGIHKYDIIVSTMELVKSQWLYGRRHGQVRGALLNDLRFVGSDDTKYHTLIVDDVHLIHDQKIDPERIYFRALCSIIARYRVGISSRILKSKIESWHSLLQFLRFSPWDNVRMFEWAFGGVLVPKNGMVGLAKPKKSQMKNFNMVKQQITFGYPETGTKQLTAATWHSGFDEAKHRLEPNSYEQASQGMAEGQKRQRNGSKLNRPRERSALRSESPMSPEVDDEQNDADHSNIEDEDEVEPSDVEKKRKAAQPDTEHTNNEPSELKPKLVKQKVAAQNEEHVHDEAREEVANQVHPNTGRILREPTEQDLSDSRLFGIDIEEIMAIYNS